MTEISVRIDCPSCGGKCGEAYKCSVPPDHHSTRPCRTCNGYGTLTKWVPLSDLAVILKKQMPNSRIIVEERLEVKQCPAS